MMNLLRRLAVIILFMIAFYGFTIHSFWWMLTPSLVAVLIMLNHFLNSKKYKDFRENLLEYNETHGVGSSGPHVSVSTNGWYRNSYSTKNLSKCADCYEPIEYSDGVLCDECNNAIHLKCIAGYAYNDPDKPLCHACYSRILNYNS